MIAPAAFAEDEYTGAIELQPSMRLETFQQRYKDFYRRQDEVEEEKERIEAGIPSVKREREAQLREQAEALQAFLKARKPYHEDPRLEEQHNMEVKAEKEQMDVLRKRYVRARDQVKAVERKGIKIPEMKEYDIED